MIRWRLWWGNGESNSVRGVNLMRVRDGLIVEAMGYVKERMSMPALEGKVAVITGATSGIGASSAELFVAEGAQVVIAGRRKDKGEQLAARLGSRASFIRTDVCVERDVTAMLDHALDIVHCIDLVRSTTRDQFLPARGLQILFWKISIPPSQCMSAACWPA